MSTPARSEQDIVAVYLPRYVVRTSLADARRIIARRTYKGLRIRVGVWRGYAERLRKALKSPAFKDSR